MSENLEKTEKTLRDLIETLRDGHQGFIELEKNLKDPEARKVFREETLVRAGFAAELENELHHFGVKDVKVAKSTAGKVHRAWGELKARLGGDDHALLQRLSEELRRPRFCKSKMRQPLQRRQPPCGFRAHDSLPAPSL